MTRQTPEFDQRIADWLEADPAVAPPDILTMVVAAIPSIPQARRGLFAPWRQPTMNGYLRLAAVAVIGVVAFGLAYLNLPSRDGIGVQPTPVASPSPTGAAASTPPALTEIRSTNSAIGVSLSVPTAWTFVIDRPGYFFVGIPYEGREPVPLAPLVGIDVQRPTDVYADVCVGPDGGLLDPALGPSVNDLVTWLASIEQLHATPPQPATVGGATGMTFDEQFRDGGLCEGGVALWPYDNDSLDGTGNKAVYVNLAVAEKRYFVVDRNGTRVVVSIAAPEGGLSLYLPEAQAVLDSLTFR